MKSFRLLLAGFACIALGILPATAADKLRFVTLEFAPFIYGENQQVAGPGRDVIAAVCTKAEIDCTFDIYPWRRAQALMKAGEADGMMVIGRNPGREEWLRFSPPMFRTEYGFFVDAGNALAYTAPDQITGYRVGVFAPSNTARTLKDIRTAMKDGGLAPIEIDQHPDDAAGFRKLAAGRLNAVFSNRDRGRVIIKDENLTGKVRYAGQHKAILYYAGITKTYAHQKVADRFFAAWLSLSAAGELQKIVEGYGLEPAPAE
jgi:polar amino acid transport system substrate-binding protein